MDQRKNVHSSQSKVPKPLNHFNKKNNFKKPDSKRENNKHFILHAPKIKIGEKIVIKKNIQNQNNEIPKINFRKILSSEENENTNNFFPKFRITADLTKSQLLTVNNNIKDNHQIKTKNVIIKKKPNEMFENKENPKKKIFILKGAHKNGKIKNNLPIIMNINNQNQNNHIQNNLINNEINIKESLNFNNLIHLNNKNNLFNFNNPNHPKKKIKLLLDKNQIINNNNNNIRYKEIIKSFFTCENPNLECQKSMEDFSYTNINFIDIENHKMSLFAIFDGHNGAIVSEFLQKNFAKTLRKNLELTQFKIEESLGNSFIEIDSELKKNKKLKMTGSTATIVLIDNNLIYCANVGDSTCYYLSIDEIKQLSIQHNIKNKKEVDRIKKNNGLIFNGRVFGSLSVTRAIGDFDFKDAGVVAIPTISREKICDKSKFVILASDGLWDVISKDDAFEMSKNMENAKGFCEMLVKDAIDKGTGDNVSCIVIQF